MVTPRRNPTFGVVAPSGYLVDTEVLPRIESYFARHGCRVLVDTGCGGRHGRFSAPDDERATALHRMAEHPDVDVVLAVRGGYGMSRLLDRLDYALLGGCGKLFAGHSDFTALNLALLARCGTISLAGPAGAFDFGAAEVDAFTESHFWALLREPEHEVRVDLTLPGADGADAITSAPVPAMGEYRGTIWGGNLALVSHLVGTPYLPRIRDGILFLEDVNEHPYRIERMLLQLHLAGVLDGQRLVLLGQFTGFEPVANDNGYGLDDAIAAIAARTRTPILRGLPFGHVRSKITIPVGATATVRVERDHYRVRFTQYPTPGRDRGTSA